MEIADLIHPVLFLKPDRVTDVTPWHGHIPFAYWCVAALKPQVFVEHGTHKGDSYSAFCQAVECLGLDTRCFAVDHWKGDNQSGFYDESVFTEFQQYHRKFERFSKLLRMDFDEALNHFEDGSIDLLHIDGCHEYSAVKREFENWRQKLSSRAVVLFHDTNSPLQRGVEKLWTDLAAEFPHFEFRHSHGLGVLVYGSDAPSAAQDLASTAAEEQQTVSAFFEGLSAALLASESERLDLPNEVLRQTKAASAAMVHTSRVVSDSLQSLRSFQEILEIASAKMGTLSQKLLNDSKRYEAYITSSSMVVQSNQEEIMRRLVAIERNQRQSLASMKRGGLPRRAWNWIRRRSVAISLTPAKEIKALSDGWYECTGSDPQLSVTSRNGRLPLGWTLIRTKIYSSTIVAHPKIYLDAGTGFTEDDVINLPSRGPSQGEVECSDYLGFLTPGLASLRIDPADRPGKVFVDIRFIQIGKVELLFRLFSIFLRRRGRGTGLKSAGRRLQSALKSGGLTGIKRLAMGLLDSQTADSYVEWARIYDRLTDQDIEAIRDKIRKLNYRPKVSIILPVYNTPERLLRECIDSVFAQIYDNWELCVADDASTKTYIPRILKEYSKKDQRVKVIYRPENGHISRASNSALEMATGEYLVRLDHDDLMAPHALYMVAEELNKHRETAFIYSDSDMIDLWGNRRLPHFKSDWDLYLMRSQNYVTHLDVYKTDLAKKIGGFRPGFEGSQDYEFTLRYIEEIDPRAIRHIPFVLYHWRQVEGSLALGSDEKPYAHTAAQRAIKEHLDRVGLPGLVEDSPIPLLHRVRLLWPGPEPSVGVSILTRDRADVLDQCMKGLLEETEYHGDISVAVVLDQFATTAVREVALKWSRRRAKVTIIEFQEKFNYSRMNNLAARSLETEYLLLLNDDVEPRDNGWLEEMVSMCRIPTVGAVGAKLFYPDGSIQHAGITLGLRGVAGHHHVQAEETASGDHGALYSIRGTSAVTGACLLIRRTAFDEVGGLEEELQVAFNDVDLCLKLGQKGFEIVWTPYAELVHHESATRGRSDHLTDRHKQEEEWMSKRWGEALTEDRFYSGNLSLHTGYDLAFPPRVRRPWIGLEDIKE